MRHPSRDLSVTRVADRLVFVGVHLGLWALINSLATVGLAAVFFFLLSNASMEGLMVELGNLSRHYGAASRESRRVFVEICCVVLGLGFVTVSASRWNALVIALRPRLQEKGGV